MVELEGVNTAVGRVLVSSWSTAEIRSPVAVAGWELVM